MRRRLMVVAALVAGGVVAGVVLTGSGGARSGAHGTPSPLDPLSAREIVATFKTIQAYRRFPKGAFFPIVALQEPPKPEVLAWSPGRPFSRRAFANVYDRAHNRLYEAIVDLRAKKVVSWVRRTGVQPAVWADEFADADALMRADKRWQQAMRRRGISPKDVYIDVWAPGEVRLPGARPGHRFLRGLSFYQHAIGTKKQQPNPYDRPIEGVVVTADMTTMKVISVIDSGFHPTAIGVSGSAPRGPKLAPLKVIQPNGPGFAIDGTLVKWRGWRFRVGYNPREGLVLYEVGYEQNGRVRPIIYRMALDEIYVPYALPDPNWTWRTAFDVGEYNLGQYAEPLERGVDVPSNATFFDEAIPSDTGTRDGAYPLPHAIALYEQNAGSLWDRTDPDSYVRDARFARELVVTSTYVIGNYTYSTTFVFRMDGGIDVRVGATGTTLNYGVRNKLDGERYGTSVLPIVSAPLHQHFFDFRIDFDVDGVANRVVEENVRSTAARGGNAFQARKTILGREGFRDASPATSRQWIVQSTTRRNLVGHPTGYSIDQLDAIRPYSSPAFAPLLRAPFAQHPLWVTRYRPGQLYAAGDYPNQGRRGQGLAKYAAGRGTLKGQDLVVWVTPGLTHVPDVEEYPVMTTETVGFSLRPDGFFDENPALNAP